MTTKWQELFFTVWFWKSKIKEKSVSGKNQLSDLYYVAMWWKKQDKATGSPLSGIGHINEAEHTKLMDLSLQSF